MAIVMPQPLETKSHHGVAPPQPHYFLTCVPPVSEHNTTSDHGGVAEEVPPRKFLSISNLAPCLRSVCSSPTCIGPPVPHQALLVYSFSVPGAHEAIFSCNVTTDGCRQGFPSPKHIPV